jgi:hypothetical protein
MQGLLARRADGVPRRDAGDPPGAPRGPPLLVARRAFSPTSCPWRGTDDDLARCASSTRCWRRRGRRPRRRGGGCSTDRRTASRAAGASTSCVAARRFTRRRRRRCSSTRSPGPSSSRSSPGSFAGSTRQVAPRRRPLHRRQPERRDQGPHRRAQPGDRLEGATSPVVALVNNVNSTLAQEKSRRGDPAALRPRGRRAATKSFMNQLAVFYCLALRLAARLPTPTPPPRPARAARQPRPPRGPPPRAARALARPRATDAAVERAAQILHLAPSVHILATRITAVAKEGALKIREVVLNHTEGFEGSEFKHGPNTILGFNTIFGPARSRSCSSDLGRASTPGGRPRRRRRALAEAARVASSRG